MRIPNGGDTRVDTIPVDSQLISNPSVLRSVPLPLTSEAWLGRRDTAAISGVPHSRSLGDPLAAVQLEREPLSPTCSGHIDHLDLVARRMGFA